MKEAKKKVQVTDQICKMAQLMRKGGANQLQVAEMLGINGSTVSRIEAAGFDKKTYDENRKARRAKEAERRKAAAFDELNEQYPEMKPAEEQVPGQIVMELTADKLTVSNPPKPITDIQLIDQDKLMRFQAAQVDKLILKLDRLNDTMSMILRAIRKE